MYVHASVNNYRINPPALYVRYFRFKSQLRDNFLNDFFVVSHNPPHMCWLVLLSSPLQIHYSLIVLNDWKRCQKTKNKLNEFQWWYSVLSFLKAEMTCHVIIWIKLKYNVPHRDNLFQYKLTHTWVSSAITHPIFWTSKKCCSNQTEHLRCCMYEGKSKIIRTLFFPIYLHKCRPEQVRHFST